MSFNPRTDCNPTTSPTGECMSVVDGLGPYCEHACLDTETLATLDEIGLGPRGEIDKSKLKFASEAASGLIDLIGQTERGNDG